MRWTFDEKLNTSGSAGSGDTFYFDYQNGSYGFNTSANRGADTFNPFSSGSSSYLVSFKVSISGNQENGDAAGSASGTGVLRINENGATLVSGSQSVGVSYSWKAKRGSAGFTITSVTPEWFKITPREIP